MANGMTVYGDTDEVNVRGTRWNDILQSQRKAEMHRQNGGRPMPYSRMPAIAPSMGIKSYALQSAASQMGIPPEHLPGFADMFLKQGLVDAQFAGDQEQRKMQALQQAEGTRRYDLERGEDSRRFDLSRGDANSRYTGELDYRKGRDSRGDLVSDRTFNAGEKRYGDEFNYRAGRDTRADEMQDQDREFTRQERENDPDRIMRGQVAAEMRGQMPPALGRGVAVAGAGMPGGDDFGVIAPRNEPPAIKKSSGGGGELLPMSKLYWQSKGVKIADPLDKEYERKERDLRIRGLENAANAGEIDPATGMTKADKFKRDEGRNANRAGIVSQIRTMAQQAVDQNRIAPELAIDRALKAYAPQLLQMGIDRPIDPAEIQVLPKYHDFSGPGITAATGGAVNEKAAFDAALAEVKRMDAMSVNAPPGLLAAAQNDPRYIIAKRDQILKVLMNSYEPHIAAAIVQRVMGQ